MPPTTTPTTTPRRAAASAQRYAVTAKGLNLRASAGIDAPVLAILAKGTMLTATGRRPSPPWIQVKHGRATGWVSAKYVQAVAPKVGPKAPPSRFPWLAIARGELGVQEVAADGDNPRIVEYLRSTSLPAPLAANDETAWCSAFANWCVERSGYAGTDSAWARSWLTWGVAMPKPTIGCIAVLRRDVDKGHVGFYLGETTTHITLLGGNQRDRVCELAFPKTDLLSYRKPR